MSMVLPTDPSGKVRRLCFIDTETTGLHVDRRAWDIAIISRQPDTGGPDRHWQAYIPVEDLDLGNAEPMALQIGGFYDRHPEMTSGLRSLASAEVDILKQVERYTRGAILVGANPAFDAETLANRMRWLGIAPSWFHRLCDVETMAAVALGEAPGARSLGGFCRAFGIEVPEAERHTAIGDAKLTLAVYDFVMAWRFGVEHTAVLNAS